MSESFRTKTTPVWEVTTRSEEETISLGRIMGNLLRPMDVLLLSGDLGAGKTRLVQGMAEGIGAATAARSPTFVLVSEIRGRITLHHCDLYRLSGPEEVDDLGLMDLVDRGDALAVEWADRAREVFPVDSLEVHLRDGERPNLRRIRAVAGGERSDQLLRWVIERAAGRVGASV